MPTEKAIVIGAGIAGIATAIRLAVQGFAVEVHEKNEVPGGKMYFIEREGYCFDAGPSLFTQPTNLEELFELAGEDISAYFSYQSVPIACRYFFEDGKVVNAHTHQEAFAAEMQRVLGEPEANVLRYLRDSGEVYNNVGSIFLNHSLHRVSTWMHPRVLKALGTVKLPYLFNTLNRFNEKRFKTPEAVQIFNRFATYNGSNPYQAPGMLSLIPHLEQNQGTFYPQGGMISIPKALVALAEKKGVRFILSSKVNSITVDNGRVTGIVANGIFVPASLVVSNVDAYYTYKHLLESDAGVRKVLRNERSSSALIFYWGIDREFPSLHLHNIFFSKQYREEFEHIFRHRKFFHDPTIYVNITAKMESGQTPAGCENWFVMVNAPAKADADWDTEVARVRQAVLEKLSRILGVEVSKHIVVEEVLTPEGIQTRTDSYLGSLYGTSSNSKWAAFLRHANFSSTVGGLYFTGGSVHPGGGIPLCLKSAAIVSELISKR
jgi:phytoene desaturase